MCPACFVSACHQAKLCMLKHGEAAAPMAGPQRRLCRYLHVLDAGIYVVVPTCARTCAKARTRRLFVLFCNPMIIAVIHQSTPRHTQSTSEDTAKSRQHHGKEGHAILLLRFPAVHMCTGVRTYVRSCVRAYVHTYARTDFVYVTII